MLTDIQRSLITYSWRNSQKTGPHGVGVVVFRRIFIDHPQIRTMFNFGDVPIHELLYNNGFQRHASIFVNMLDETIGNLRNLATFIPKLHEIGRKHVDLIPRGFRIEYWDFFVEALTESARDWNRYIRNQDKTNRAWTILMSFLVYEMRFAFKAELRIRKKNNMMHTESARQLVEPPLHRSEYIIDEVKLCLTTRTICWSAVNTQCSPRRTATISQSSEPRSTRRRRLPKIPGIDSNKRNT